MQQKRSLLSNYLDICFNYRSTWAIRVRLCRRGTAGGRGPVVPGRVAGEHPTGSDNGTAAAAADSAAGPAGAAGGAVTRRH